jgi:hypothetical protein
MNTYNSPDSSICEWWDMLCKDGKVIRIKYCEKWKHDYPWHSVEHAYSQDRIEFIGHKFIPVELTSKEDF